MVLIYRKNRWNKTFSKTKRAARGSFLRARQKGVGGKMSGARRVRLFLIFSHSPLTNGKTCGKILICKGDDGENDRVLPIQRAVGR